MPSLTRTSDTSYSTEAAHKTPRKSNPLTAIAWAQPSILAAPFPDLASRLWRPSRRDNSGTGMCRWNKMAFSPSNILVSQLKRSKTCSSTQSSSSLCQTARRRPFHGQLRTWDGKRTHRSGHRLVQRIWKSRISYNSYVFLCYFW